MMWRGGQHIVVLLHIEHIEAMQVVQNNYVVLRLRITEKILNTLLTIVASDTWMNYSMVNLNSNASL